MKCAEEMKYEEIPVFMHLVLSLDNKKPKWRCHICLSQFQFAAWKRIVAMQFPLGWFERRLYHTHICIYYSVCSHFDWILMSAMDTTIQFVRQSTDSIADCNFRFHYYNQRIRKISIFPSLSNSGKWLNEEWEKFMTLLLRTDGWVWVTAGE